MMHVRDGGNVNDVVQAGARDALVFAILVCCVNLLQVGCTTERDAVGSNADDWAIFLYRDTVQFMQAE
jgi:hypothetical protein